MSDISGKSIRVDMRLSDIAYALEGWETKDIGRFVGLLLFNGVEMAILDFLDEQAPPREHCSDMMNALIDGIYEYARGAIQ